MPAAPDPPAPAPNAIDHRRDALLIAGLLLAVHVGGAFEWLAPPSADLARAAAARLLIDPNTAPADELMLLPGIGPALSSRIVQYRQASATHPAFAAANDLEAVKRIGPITVEKLRPFLTFAAQAEPLP